MNPHARTSDPSTASEVAEEFLRDIERTVALPDRVSATDAALAVVCTLTTRLSGGEVRDLHETLPRSVVGLLRQCPRHRDEPGESFGSSEFLRRVAEHSGVDAREAEAIVIAVFSALRARVPAKEDADVMSQLPGGLSRMWAAALPELSAPSESAPPTVTRPSWHRVLGDIDESGTLVPSVNSARAFAVVMCTLMRRLSSGEARDLAYATPLPLRPLLEPCAVRAEERGEVFDRPEFIRRVAKHLCSTKSEAEETARAVFAAAQRVMTPKQVTDVARQLPHDLKGIWIDPEGSSTARLADRQSPDAGSPPI